MHAIIPALPNLTKSSMLPALTALLEHAVTTEEKACASDDLLFKTLGLEPASAAYLAHADGLDITLGVQWLCASPVVCQAEHAAIFIVKDESLHLSPALNDELFKLIKIYLATDHVDAVLERGISGRWYLCLQTSSLFKTEPLECVLGQAVFQNVAQRSDQMHAHRLFLELQMLLEQHKLYQKCETHVNAIWLWGDGCLQTNKTGFDAVICSDDVLAHSIANLHGLTCVPFSEKMNPARFDMFFFKDLWLAKSTGNDNLYQEKLAALETSFFEPCLQALRKGQLNELVLIQPEGLLHRMTSKAFQPWWKRAFLR